MTYDIYKFRASVDVRDGFDKTFEKLCAAVRAFVKGHTGIELGTSDFDDGHI